MHELILSEIRNCDPFMDPHKAEMSARPAYLVNFQIPDFQPLPKVSSNVWWSSIA